jgi:hypothetical protein
MDPIDDELLHDERVVWRGRPDPSKRFTRGDVFFIPFSVFWASFTIFWEALAIASGDVFFIVWGIPFVLMGVFFVIGRFFYKAWIKRRTWYALTDRRVLAIVDGLRGRNVSAAFVDRIPTVNATIGRDGTGTIVFGNRPWAYAMYANTGLDFMGARYAGDAVAFNDVPDAAEIVRLVNELRSRNG